MVAIRLCGKFGCAISTDPVTKLRGLSYKSTLPIGGLYRMPGFTPFAIH